MSTMIGFDEKKSAWLLSIVEKKTYQLNYPLFRTQTNKLIASHLANRLCFDYRPLENEKVCLDFSCGFNFILMSQVQSIISYVKTLIKQYGLT